MKQSQNWIEILKGDDTSIQFSCNCSCCNGNEGWTFMFFHGRNLLHHHNKPQFEKRWSHLHAESTLCTRISWVFPRITVPLNFTKIIFREGSYPPCFCRLICWLLRGMGNDPRWNQWSRVVQVDMKQLGQILLLQKNMNVQFANRWDFGRNVIDLIFFGVCQIDVHSIDL